jgi:hypothetical protein
MPNIEETDFVLRDGPPGFRSKRARIGFELGPDGAHQLLNPTAEPVRFDLDDQVDYWRGEAPPGLPADS